MGLLALGTPFNWAEAQKFADHVRQHGIEQFIALWNGSHNRTGDEPLWGDEIEYVIVALDEQSKSVRLSLHQSDILAKLNSLESSGIILPLDVSDFPKFHPEYGRYMLETTPGAPYGPSLLDLMKVESDMRCRRLLAKSQLRPNELPITITNFPRLGAQGSSFEPDYDCTGPEAQSFYLPDQVINTHIRFPTLTSNIRQRRGSKVEILIPIYRDIKTPSPFYDTTYSNQGGSLSKPSVPEGHIHMDAMAFGMGCCCLQITFQACSVTEARVMYDAFVPVAPIMMAISAGAPVFKGFLSDRDCRWDVIAGSVDDRTEEERGLKPLVMSRFRIPKSRYDSTKQ